MGWAIALFLVFVCGIAALLCAEHDKEKGAEKEFKKLLARLRDEGHDTAVEDALLHRIKQPRFGRISKKLGEEAYLVALDNLAANIDKPAAKAFVLEIGVWHRARCRPNKKLTAADEQAVQNDILVRCRMLINRRAQPAGWTE